MDRLEAGQESARYLLGKIVVLVVFVSIMGGLIFYFNKNEPDIKRMTLISLAEQFSTSVTNAHWQWQAEGRPQIVMLVHYAPRLDDDQQLIEKDRRPIQMSHLGWPKSSATSEGCGKLWEMVLNMPLSIEGFRVFPEYFAGSEGNEPSRDSRCRFRLSVGPYFDYHINTGRVSDVQD